MKETNKFHFSSSFETLLSFSLVCHADQMIFWWRICRWLSVNFNIHWCIFSANYDLGEGLFSCLYKRVIAWTDLWSKESERQSRSQKRFRHYDICEIYERVVTFFSFLRNTFTVSFLHGSFTMVIKWSPGGDCAVDWGSKSTCVVPAWTLTSKHASRLGVRASRSVLLFFFGSVQAGIASTEPWPQEMFTFLKMRANRRSLAWTCLKAVSVPSRRKSAFVMGGLRGFIHTCLFLPCQDVALRFQ